MPRLMDEDAMVRFFSGQLELSEEVILEPIREVWIHGGGFAASRLSMMRIMARRMNAATVVV